MLAADHRVIKQLKPMAGANAGLTPMLMGRGLDKDSTAKNAFDNLIKKPDLREIREEREEAEAAEAKNAKATNTKANAAKNALKGL